MEKGAVRWVKMMLFFAALAALLLFMASIGSLMKLMVISALLAYVIDPLACFLESRGLSRASASIAIFLAIGLIVVVFGYFFLPILISEVMSLQSGFDYAKADAMISNVENLIKDNFAFLGVRELNLMDKVKNATVYIGSWVFNHLLDVVSLITSLVIVPFLVFFLLKDGRDIIKQFLSILPNRYFECAANLFFKMDLQLGNYLRGQFLDAGIIGILSIFALWLLDVRYFFIIGSIAGLANLIPYLGPVAGATIAAVFSILDTGNFNKVAYIVIAFVVIRLIDDVLVQPLIVARSVKMHPLMVLLALIIGGKFFGILGMLLSVPVAGFMIVVLKEGIISFKKYSVT